MLEPVLVALIESVDCGVVVMLLLPVMVALEVAVRDPVVVPETETVDEAVRVTVDVPEIEPVLVCDEVTELDPVDETVDDAVIDTLVVTDDVPELVAVLLALMEFVEVIVLDAVLVPVLLAVTDIDELALELPDTDAEVVAEAVAVDVWVLDGDVTSQLRNAPAYLRSSTVFNE